MPDKQTKTASKPDYRRLADYLQQQRRNKRYSIRKVSTITKLPESTIRALENPHKYTLPSANIQGLYQLYGDALEVNPQRITKLLKVEEDVAVNLRLPRLPKIKSLVVFSNIGVRIAVFVIISIIILYAIWLGFGLITAPRLEVANPPELNTIVSSSVLSVEGTTRRESTVLINGVPVPLNGEDGSFSQEVYLQEGLNTITVEAVNNFSRSTTKEFKVMFVSEN